MKIEIDEVAGVTIWACLATVCIFAAAMGGCAQCEKTNRAAIEAGLVQSTPQPTTTWVKPRE